MKIVVRIVLGVVIVLVLALVGAFVFIDPLLKKAIEQGATYGTGVPTHVEKVDAGLTSGTLSLSELSIDNPPGFRSGPFFHLSSAQAAWDNRSILSDEIHIDEFKLDGVTIDLERAGNQSNYGTILANLDRLAGKDGKNKKDGAQKTIQIRQIEITNVKVGLHLSGVPLAQGDLEIAVPRIALDHFDSSGSTSENVANLTHAIVQAIIEATTKAGQGQIPVEILTDLASSVANLPHELEQRGGELLKDAGKTLEGALKGSAPKKKK